MQLKVLTIITESILENSLAEVIDKCGAQGYTVTDARGKGSKGSRGADWSNNSNIRMEIICTEEVCDELTKHLKDKYYNDFAMITFSHDVDVIRNGKF